MENSKYVRLSDPVSAVFAQLPENTSSQPSSVRQSAAFCMGRLPLFRFRYSMNGILPHNMFASGFFPSFRESAFHMFKKALVAAAAAAALLSSSFASAETVSVTTGAGYVPMVKALAKAYTEETGAAVTENFGGNIGQVLAQVDAGNGVNVVITDRGMLSRLKTPVKFAGTTDLGPTQLVLVWRKGLSLASAEDINSNKVKSVALPDPKAAVYGRAGSQFLAGKGWDKSLSSKIMQVSNVPQAFSYVARGEVDTAFVNRQIVAKQGEKVGGSLEITEGYEKLELIAAAVEGKENDKDIAAFLSFLKGEKAKKIMKNFGVY